MARSIYMPEMTNLQVREYLESGPRGTVIVPGRIDRGSRRPRAAVDRRLHPDRGREAGRAGARRPGRPSDRVRPGARPSRRARSRLRPPRDLRAPRPRRLRDARRGGLQANRAAERALRELLGAAVRGGRDLRRPPRRRAHLPVPLLAGSRARRSGGVPLRDGRDPCERRRDLGRARDRPGALRHGASARLRPRPRRAAHESVRADRSCLPFDAGIVLVAAGGGRRRLGRAEHVDRREGRAVSRVVQDEPSSTSSATWTTSTTGSACASDHRRGSGRGIHGLRAYRELQGARRPRPRQGDRVAERRPRRAAGGNGRSRGDERPRRRAARPGGRRSRHLPSHTGSPRRRRAGASRRQARVPGEADRADAGGRGRDPAGGRGERQVVHGRPGAALLARVRRAATAGRRRRARPA